MPAKLKYPARMTTALIILASVVVSSEAAAQFQAIDSNHVFVLGSDGILWFEHDFTGTVPPPRIEVDANTNFYEPFSALNSNQAYVLGNDSKLWFEHDFTGTVPPPRTEVDANVAYFWPIDSTDICVEGSDGKLWLEHNFTGAVPPPRTASVIGDACQPQSAYWLDDDNLWFQWLPWIAPIQVDGNVTSFTVVDNSHVFVRGVDHKLWFEYNFTGTVPPPRALVFGGTGVLDFQVMNADNVYFVDENGSLWNASSPFGETPPVPVEFSSGCSYKEADGDCVLTRSVANFQGISDNQVFVEMNNDLYLETRPFNAGGATPIHIDANLE